MLIFRLSISFDFDAIWDSWSSVSFETKAQIASSAGRSFRFAIFGSISMMSIGICAIFMSYSSRLFAMFWSKYRLIWFVIILSNYHSYDWSKRTSNSVVFEGNIYLNNNVNSHIAIKFSQIYKMYQSVKDLPQLIQLYIQITNGGVSLTSVRRTCRWIDGIFIEKAFKSTPRETRWSGRVFADWGSNDNHTTSSASPVFFDPSQKKFFSVRSRLEGLGEIKCSVC